MRRYERLTWVLFAFTVLLLGPSAAAAATAEKIPVPRITIYPGDQIEAGMLVWRRVRSSKLQRLPIIRQPRELIDKVSRRTLLPGRPVLRNAIRNRHIIKRGKVSTVVYRSGGLVITNSATALESGSTGDVIKLRNIESGRTVTGIVQGNGTVLIGP